MTVSANDSHEYPIYNARFRVRFPILDADGDLVTAAAGLDSELSQDSGTFADATNEATEIATSSGIYFLDLVAGEMDTKSTDVIVKTSTAGAKTTVLTLSPRRLPVVRTGTAQAGAASTITLDSGASGLDDFYNGCFVNITNNSPANALGQARKITDYVGSTKVATVEGTWGTNPSSASTFEVLLTPEACSAVALAGTPVAATTAGRADVNLTHIANATVSTTSAQLGVNTVQAGATAWGSGAITAASIATDAITAAKIADGAIDAATFAAGAIDAAAIATDAIGAAELADGAITAATFAAGAIDATAIATGAVDADALATDAVDEIWEYATTNIGTAGGIGKLLVDNVNATISSRATQTSVDTVDDFLDTEIAAIKAKTDSLTFTTALRVDAQVFGMEANSVTAAAIAANAIGASEIADGAIDAATFAAGAVDEAAIGFTAFKRAVLGNVIGTVGAASSTTSVVTSSLTPAAAVADQYKSRILTFDRDTTTANLRGQATDITANTAAGVLTVSALTTAPASGDTFTIT